MREGLLFMKRNSFFRALCVALCAALLLGTFAILFSSLAAAEEEEEIVAVVPAQEDEAAPEADKAPARAETPVSEVSQAEEAPNFLVGALDWFFRTFGFIGFTLDPYQFTIINQTPTFQWLLGFNDFYDQLPWVVNVWTDHFTCQFPYEGKDWRIQFWKGGYGLCLATGGEIGVYNKTWDLEHYACPVDQNDWMYLEYSVYNKGKHLFTRPSPRLSGDTGPYWWATGYRVLSICTDFFNGPRKNVIMDATLPFKSVEMRTAFINAMPGEFEPLPAGQTLSLSTPEKYTLGTKMTPDGEQPCLRFIWQNFTKGIY